MRRLVLFVATAATLMCNQGHARTKHNLLRGASKIALSIEKQSPEAKECGLTEEAIRAAVMYPLSSSKVELVPANDADAVVLYVNIASLYLKEDQTCFSSLSIQVYTYQKVTLEFSGDEKYAWIELWTSGGVASSYPSRHAQRMTSFIEDKVKKFITDWNLDNKP
jgi:hypothetical protein